ncbi:hypothetical protein GLOTRDRAFT_65416 [Gloeophyllum trabeum ATCC 11539]|uniref:HIG1 domain-containing protein n=1 Tax=Gloeophyllum trabeum (strain ATCC 11539 / FP-39264 / Madison 617) TaxID=670483 RepID=S7PWD0_GLOTA|nr:uncharacterized protein GLOTRDRAFT_65416 [Gloeophyllum trabeum ATCC 11539]EPQ51828.1 hypothetical protein GLOTRDRAFT_65416 [Gloeophyllum trabeum ATCC 11539]
MSFPTPVPAARTTESFRDKAIRKFKEEPLVPIGTLATCVALTMATVKMRSGQPKSFNNWLRVRIIAQGLTIAAVVAGSYAYGRTQKQQEEKARSEQERLLANAAKERQEFEERLREAEEAHEREQSAKGLLGFKRWGSSGEGDGSVKALDGDANKVSKHMRVEELAKQREGQSGGNWFEWLWGSSSSEGGKEEKKSP